jgi:DNA-binding response OmpR family regulator
MRVLLVEDEAGVARFIRKGLEEEGYAVEQATNGVDGLELALHGGVYDLLILDVNLPRLDGIELCRRVRGAHLHTPVLMLTARKEVEDKVRGLDSGADDYLTKPFAFDEFLARVRALLRRKGEALVEYSVGALRVDPQAHRVFVDGQEVMLRPKEYQLLVALLAGKGRVLSRTQLLEKVWGYDYDPSTNVVDVQVKSLRDKLRGLLAQDPIRTVRGAGYMIDDPA